ncbi:uncharacterized protein LOC116851758 [Odontomachus brunneus]|uniref:uncharacterized protein LOC116851758 n=1 Tax=Odontomachus brunneus TaxID=486640 RepID=UPI0013F1BF4B|nr:uncharacterized protein LOC116851758 [Odontomachus brunneus]
MAAECQENGTILDFSAFKYESFMAVIKHNLRSTYKPLQQLANRDIETEGQLVTESRRPNPNKITLKKQLFRNIVPEIPGNRYAQINLKGVTLTTNEANCCFSSKDGKIFILIEVIVAPNGDILLAGHRFLCKADYYDYPLPSSSIGIFKVSHVDPVKSMCRLQDFFQKCVILPDGDSFLCIPLLHSGFQ